MAIMATTHEQKPTLITINHASPLDQYGHEEEEEEEDMDEDQNRDDTAASFCGFGGCFRLFGTCWKSNDHERKSLLQQEGGGHKEITWWRKKLNKATECTEVLGGPKWKTFVRKIGGYWRSMKQKQKNGLSKKQKQKNTRFQYDLHSYVLNFDGGVGRDEDDGVLDFATRFAAPLPNETNVSTESKY